MKNIKEILVWLSGKKGSIAALIGLAIAYCATKGFIGEAEVYLFSGANVIIFGAASYATSKLIYNK